MASPHSRQQRPRARLGVAILAGGLALVVALVAVSVVLFAGSDDDSAPGDSASTEIDPDDEPAAEPNEPTAKVELRRVEKVFKRSVDCEAPGIWCSQSGGGYRLGPAELRTKDIVSAEARISDYGDFVVGVTLSEEGAERFEAVTTELAENTGIEAQLAIVVNGRVISAPTVQGPIPGGEIDIAAEYTQQEAERLAEAIDP